MARQEYFANVPMLLGEDRYNPGDLLPHKDYTDRRWDRMLARNEVSVRYVQDEEVEEAATEEASDGVDSTDEAPDLSELSKASLVDLLVEMGIDAESIEGTGSNGFITKDDLIARIEAEAR